MNMIKKAGLVTAAAGGLMAVGVGAAHAEAEADGAAVGSPGVLSGNNIQVPIHIPLNVCGNTINVFSALNPTFGNTCLNAS